VQGDRLIVDIPEIYPQGLTLYPQSETAFFLAEDAAELVFSMDEKPVACQLCFQDTTLKAIQVPSP